MLLMFLYAVSSAATPAAGKIDVELVVGGLVAPLDLTYAPDGSGRRFIVDLTGLVLILTPGDALLPTPLLDITSQVIIQSAFDERGLLAVAFHPQFASNGKLYVQYSAPRDGDNICVDADGNVPTEPEGCPLQYTRTISEFSASADDPNQVDPSTERVLLTKQWPGRKHNGGGLTFGPDGLLYIGFGDGGLIHGPDGSGNQFDIDPDLLFGELYAQDMSRLFGKILRIDVDNGAPYAIPSGNPFAGDDGIPDEIYAWGFRNPYRIAFDTAGDRAMYVSATAETLFEATYKVTGPGNYGWATREGSHCIVRASAYAPPETVACASDADCPVGPQVSTCGADGYCICPDTGPLGEPIRAPVIEYLNYSVEDPQSQLAGAGLGRASLGGHVYRGPAMPWLRGRFVQGDFAVNVFDGQIILAKPGMNRVWKLQRAFTFDADDPGRSGFMKSIGQDADGELYAITGNFTPTGLEGKVWKIVDGRRRGGHD